jgi:hypothetical protein
MHTSTPHSKAWNETCSCGLLAEGNEQCASWLKLNIDHGMATSLRMFTQGHGGALKTTGRRCQRRVGQVPTVGLGDGGRPGDVTCGRRVQPSKLRLLCASSFPLAPSSVRLYVDKAPICRCSLLVIRMPFQEHDDPCLYRDSCSTHVLCSCRRPTVVGSSKKKTISYRVTLGLSKQAELPVVRHLARTGVYQDSLVTFLPLVGSWQHTVHE